MKSHCQTCGLDITGQVCTSKKTQKKYCSRKCHRMSIKKQGWRYRTGSEGNPK